MFYWFSSDTIITLEHLPELLPSMYLNINVNETAYWTVFCFDTWTCCPPLAVISDVIIVCNLKSEAFY